MKILKRLSMIAASVAVLAACALTSCKYDKSQPIDNEAMRAYIDEQLQILSQPADSLGNTVVYVKQEVADSGRYDSEFGDEVIVPVVAIVTPFATLVAIVFIIAWFRRKNVLTKAHVMEAAIAKGVTVPESFFANYNVKRTRLQSSMVWMAFGIGIAGFFLIIEAYQVAMLGVIVLLVGAAKLITYLVEDRKTNLTSEESDCDAEQI